MVVEIAISLAEALVAIIKSSSDNRQVDYIKQQLVEIGKCVLDTQNLLHGITDEMIRKEDPELQRFERAKAVASRVFNIECDESLLDFATEILSAVMDDSLSGVRIQVDAKVQDPNMAIGFREKSFDTVVMASKSVFDNAKQLSHFFGLVLDFNGFNPIPLRRQPSMMVSLAKGDSSDLEQQDRVKNRMCARLLLLNTMSFNWADDGLGTLISDKRYLVQKDSNFTKFVRGQDQCTLLVKAVRDRMICGRYYEAISEVWNNVIMSEIGSVRVIVLSQDLWRDSPRAKEPKQITENIRTYVETHNQHRVKWLEILMDDFDDWDEVNLKSAIVNEMSTSVLVFRFSCIPGLHRLVCKSKEITDMFPGLTTHKDRIMYVDTTTKNGFGSRRAAIRQVARSLRLLEPRDEIDILFEADDFQSASKDIRQRAVETKTLLCDWYKGDSRQHLTSIIHILNREIDISEAKEETEQVMKFISLLRSPLWTNVRVYRNPDLILVQRGDATGFGLSNSELHYVRETDYNSFHDITARSPPQVTAKICLRHAPQGLYDTRMFASNWRVVQKMEDLVKASQLFMTVAGEKMIGINKRHEMVLSGVVVSVIGGGMREYLHGKMIWCSLQAVREDCSKGQDVMRALLRIAPALQVATGCSVQLSRFDSTTPPHLRR